MRWGFPICARGATATPLPSAALPGSDRTSRHAPCRVVDATVRPSVPCAICVSRAARARYSYSFFLENQVARRCRANHDDLRFYHGQDVATSRACDAPEEATSASSSREKAGADLGSRSALRPQGDQLPPQLQKALPLAPRHARQGGRCSRRPTRSLERTYSRPPEEDLPQARPFWAAGARRQVR